MKEKAVKNNLEKVDTRVLDSAATKAVYWIFQAFILLTLLVSIVLCIVRKQEREIHINHIFLCSVALIVYNIPSFLKKRFHVYIPTVLQVFTLIFIYTHFIMGEIQGVYTTSAVFDKILHTTSGLAIATIGFSLVNILNTSKNTHLQLSPFFVALFAFCFALAVAVVWEIFEFCGDTFFGMNMQRYVPPDNLLTEQAPAQGYGLIDTMGDIIVSTIAALAVCLLGYISLKTKKNYMNKFLLRIVPTYDVAIEEAQLAGDEKLVENLEKAKIKSLLASENEVKKENELENTDNIAIKQDSLGESDATEK